MIFEFGLPDIIAYSQRNIAIPHLVRSCCWFLQDSFILSPAVRHRTGCFPTRYSLIVFKQGTLHAEVVYVHQASIFEEASHKRG